MAKRNPKAFYAAHKKAVLAVISLVLAVSLGLGIWYFAANSSSEPVYVYPFQYIGMTEYWGDSQESYGPVSSDNIQTVFLSDTQTVTEVLVKEGDTVKKGDLLMSFDTTLDDLKLERKRLDVEKQKLELEAANKRLTEIRNLVPMQIITIPPDNEFDYDETLGETIIGYKIYGKDFGSLQNALNFDGSSEVKPLVVWMDSNTGFHADMVQWLRDTAGKLQWINLQYAMSDGPVEGADDEFDFSSEPVIPEVDFDTAGSVPVGNFYVVVRTTEGNRQYAATKTWEGLRVVGSGIQFFTPVVSDPFMEGYVGDEAMGSTEINLGSIYTAAQIAEMRKEQEKKIKELEFQVKMVETEYKLMEKEFNDGNIYAEVDGEVVSVLTEEEAKSSRQPVIKVSGGGGFYVEGLVNELEKEKMEIGLSVTVNDWNTGMTYEAEVASVGDFPNQEGYWNGMGNPNSSYYPFQVFVDGSADLQTGSYVSVMYSTSEGGNGVYLENPFIRTENGSSYVLALGADGCLEQRFVVTGKSLWGNYTEIRSGITPEDLIAFPYGKHVRPGVKAIEGDMSNLYG